jgi:hypothetical protein
MRRDVLEHDESDAEGSRWLLPAFRTVAMATIAGLLTTMLRAGSLLAMAVSSVPFWKRVDPLVILSLSEEERRDLRDRLRVVSREEEHLDELLQGRTEDKNADEDDPDLSARNAREEDSSLQPHG